jgi:hypothetical protein
MQCTTDATVAADVQLSPNPFWRPAVIVQLGSYRGAMAQDRLLSEQHLTSKLRRHQQATVSQIASCGGAGCCG